LKSLNSSHPNIAYLFAALGYCFQAFLQIAFKYVARVVPPFQTLFMRGFCLFVLNVFILHKTRESAYVRSPWGTLPSIQSSGSS
jgi:drug/metabolite transporter (DMT)-like permease